MASTNVVYLERKFGGIAMRTMLKGLMSALLLVVAPASMAATVADEIVLGNGDMAIFSSTPFAADDLTVWVPIHFTSDGGGFSVSTASSVPVNMASMTLYTSDSTYSGTFTEVASGAFVETSTVGGVTYFQWALNTFLTQGYYILQLVGTGAGSVHGTISAVPLPGAAVLFGTALLGAGVVRRRKAAARQLEAVAA